VNNHPTSPLSGQASHQSSASPPQAPCLSLKGSVGPSCCAADSTARVYDQAFNISSLNINIAGHPALHVCRLIITYNLWEASKAMVHSFLPIT
jgi:hypothetical protein